MEKYYFVTYYVSCRYYQNAITTTHPIEYIKNYSSQRKDLNLSLVWWTELTKEEYEKYK